MALSRFTPAFSDVANARRARSGAHRLASGLCASLCAEIYETTKIGDGCDARVTYSASIMAAAGADNGFVWLDGTEFKPSCLASRWLISCSASEQKCLATAHPARGWFAKLGATTLYIEPGSPWENGYCESFNGKLRDECFNGEIFYSAQALQHHQTALIAELPITGAADIIAKMLHLDRSASMQ